MAESYDVINLSDLPVPDAIVVPDAAVIFGAWLARLRELDPEFDALVESDPTYKPANPDAVPPTDAVMEEDEAFRERIQLSWSQLNTAGARNAYRFHARSADEDVLDADAYGPEEHGRAGEVDVYVLSREGNGTTSKALLDAVSARLNADEIRPLTDFVTVKSAIINDYSVTAELEIPDGPDAGEVLENAKNTLLSYTRLATRINGMVPLSAIYAALQQTGVARVILSSPRADIEPATGTAPRCAAVNVTRREV